MRAPLTFFLLLFVITAGCSSFISAPGSEGSVPELDSPGGGGSELPGITPEDEGITDTIYMFTSGDFIDDQELVIPENAQVGNTVGRAKLYPTASLVNPSFTIASGDPQGLFEIDSDTGIISVKTAGLFDASATTSYALQVTVNGGTDDAIITVKILDQNSVVFIDPSINDPSENGSRVHPFNSLDDFWIGNYSEGTAFLLKRSTVMNRTQEFSTDLPHMIFGAYGTGERPVINFIGDHIEHALGHGPNVGYVTIRDLEISAPDGLSCVLLHGGHHATIENFVCHGPTWGIRAGGQDHRFLYNEIYDIEDDGIFMNTVTGTEIAYNNIHHVNTDWVHPYTSQDIASGDAIQFLRVDNWHVHHNVLDRTNSGNKFGFIMSGETPIGGIFEHNLLTGPLTTGDGGASMYLGADTSGLIVRYNVIKGPSPQGIFDIGRDQQIYGNIFDGTDIGVYFLSLYAEEIETCNINNNTFHNVPVGIYANGDPNAKVSARNNIFSLTEPDHVALHLINTIQKDTDYNLFSQGPVGPGPHSFVDDPKFQDVSNHDFRLQETSPAIDAGTDVGLPFTGNAPDLGAFEYEP